MEPSIFSFLVCMGHRSIVSLIVCLTYSWGLAHPLSARSFWSLNIWLLYPDPARPTDTSTLGGISSSIPFSFQLGISMNVGPLVTNTSLTGTVVWQMCPPSPVRSIHPLLLIWWMYIYCLTPVVLHSHHHGFSHFWAIEDISSVIGVWLPSMNWFIIFRVS